MPKRISVELSKKFLKAHALFYYTLEGNLFAAKRIPLDKTTLELVIFKRLGDNLMRFGSGKLVESFDSIEISDTWFGSAKRIIAPVPEEKGQDAFRIFLAEAIRLAKAKKKNISIYAANQKLREYYAGFGFRFESKVDPNFGELVLFKKKKQEAFD